MTKKIIEKELKKKIKTKLDYYGLCPVCKESWDGGDIPKDIRKHYNKPYKWSKLAGIETREKYDFVSQWQCPFCKTKWDRWTEEIVESKEAKKQNVR